MEYWHVFENDLGSAYVVEYLMQFSRVSVHITLSLLAPSSVPPVPTNSIVCSCRPWLDDQVCSMSKLFKVVEKVYNVYETSKNKFI